MIPDEIVEQVRDSADIVQIIGEYVSLKRAGVDFRGPCPFHQGTHRNFSVSPKKHMYYCFVCHEGGDVFRFLQKRLGVEWPEAVKLVGQKTGIEVVDTHERKGTPDHRESLWELNATAAEYFHQLLWNDRIGLDAREYLQRRGIERALAEQFELGFAPREIGLLRNYMNSLGYDDARMIGAGLLTKGDDEAEPRPRFRNRLIFPILDAQGRHVGFGGRLLSEGEPKYLNSPESPVFSKSKTLYGLNWARSHIAKEDRAVIVEGYFDLIRVVEAGIRSCVAPLGTALTEQQAGLLKRVGNVFLLYDSDKPGLKATFRSGDELLKQGISVRVASLPPGEDPDTFVRKNGFAGIEKALSEAVDLFERKIQILQRGGWFADLHKKRRALDRLLPTLRATNDPITRDLYLARAHEVSGIARDVLAREVGVLPSQTDISPHQRPEPETVQPRRENPSAHAKPRASVAQPGASAERELIRLMIIWRDYVNVISEKLAPEDFWNLDFRAIYVRLLKDPSATIEALTHDLNESAIQHVAAVLAESGEHAFLRDALNNDQTLNDSLAKLSARELSRRKADIDRLTPIAGSEEKTDLTFRKVALEKELRESQPKSMTAGIPRKQR
jgi:DNA primase